MTMDVFTSGCCSTARGACSCLRGITSDTVSPQQGLNDPFVCPVSGHADLWEKVGMCPTGTFTIEEVGM